MRQCASCGQPIDPGDRSVLFVWLGMALDPYRAESKPDVHLHERCVDRWKPPDPYYHDSRLPFPDSGM